MSRNKAERSRRKKIKSPVWLCLEEVEEEEEEEEKRKNLTEREKGGNEANTYTQKKRG